MRPTLVKAFRGTSSLLLWYKSPMLTPKCQAISGFFVKVRKRPYGGVRSCPAAPRRQAQGRQDYPLPRGVVQDRLRTLSPSLVVVLGLVFQRTSQALTVRVATLVVSLGLIFAVPEALVVVRGV